MERSKGKERKIFKMAQSMKENFTKINIRAKELCIILMGVYIQEIFSQVYLKDTENLIGPTKNVMKGNGLEVKNMAKESTFIVMVKSILEILLMIFLMALEH